MKTLRTFLAASLAALCLVAPTGCATLGLAGKAATTSKATGPVVEDTTGPLKYRMTTLGNGMRVVSVEDFSTPIAAVQVWYHVGSKDEDPERQGFAHMFEHMMFRGTEKTGPKDHFEYIRNVGGDVNAYTSFDNTTYIQTLPANQLEMVLWLESERMAFLKINDENFRTERKVVEEERRQGLERPFGSVPEKLVAEMFKVHPYRWTPIGNIPMLRAANSAELQKFWETYYVPNNATLVVVGAVKHEDVEKMASRYFGWIPSYPEPPRVTVREPEQTKPRKITIQEKGVPVSVVAAGYFTVPVGHPDEIPLQMLFTILGGGESSRLTRELVNKNETAVFAAAGAFSLEQAGLGGAAAVLTPLGNKDKARKELLEHIARVKADGVTAEELEKARNEFLRNEVVKLQTVEAKAQAIGQAVVIEGNVANVNNRLGAIKAVTVEDIKRVANQYLLDDRRNDITIEPSIAGFLLGSLVKPQAAEEDAPVAPAPEGAKFGHGKPGLERPAFYGDAPPKAPLVSKAEMPAPKEATLENGLKVVVVEDHEIPFVSYTLGLRYGAYTDDNTTVGAASMAASMLTRGTQNYTYEKLAETLDRNAITLGGSIGMDSGAVSASAVTEKAGMAMELLAEAVLRPTFPKDEFDKLRKQALTGLAISEGDPSTMADREMSRRLFGEHPYARTASGESQDLPKLSPETSSAWWRKHVRPDSAVLFVSGDMTQERALELARANFGSWKAEGPAPEYQLPEIPRHDGTRIYLVDKKGSVQSQIRIGQQGITRQSPEFFDSRIVSQVFGGSFGSRLNEAVRIQKGLTYGAGGGFRASRFAGEFISSTFSKTESTAEATKVIIDEIRRLKTDPITEKEFTLARNFLLGNFVVSRETPSDVVSDYWLVDYAGLPADFFQRYLSAIGGTSTAKVNAAAQSLVDPENLIIVIVGDAEKIRPDLEKIAPVTLVDPKGATKG